jgi:uncharacterized protein YwqG
MLIQALFALSGATLLPISAQSTRRMKSPAKTAQRTFPMFKDQADAHAVIKQYCIDEAEEPISAAHADLLASRLKPQFWIAPQPAAGVPQFLSHFGGAPDLPKGASWPLRPVPVDAEQRAAEFNKHKSQSWVAEHIVRELPFEFIAQIDLAEAAQHPSLIGGLPDVGRLLFFWDGVVGLHVEGQSACQVIWDQTPPADVAPVPIPAVFDELERAFATGQHLSAKEMAQDLLKGLPDTLKFMRSTGLAEQDIKKAEKAIREQFKQPPAFNPSAKKPYVYPRRAMALTPILHLPHARSAEVALDAALSTLLKDDWVADCYQILTSRDEGPFAGDKQNAGQRRQRFLGTPDPEQDDPLYAAVDKSTYPAGVWSEANIQDASRQASAWRLLLQIDWADLAQVGGEGTVCFIIRADHLAQRDFSKVHAVYQQT